MFRQGIDIDIIEDSLGKESFILSYNGNQPAFEYLELKYLINHDVKIKTLYLDMYAYSISVKPKISDERLLIYTDTKFKFDVWNMLKEAKNNSMAVFWELFVTSNNESLLTFPISFKMTNRLYKKGGNIQNNKGTTLEKLN